MKQGAALMSLLLRLAVLVATALPVRAGGLELVMVEQPGCAYCAAWDAEIAPAYPKTAEGKAAPLRRIQLHDPVPGDLTLEAPPTVTPTFILVEDGVERDRIVGYPGDAFFWPILGRMLAEAGVAP
jgi:hypothetical protein